MLIIKDGIQKETLRTTIRRDLSLFSVQASATRLWKIPSIKTWVVL